MFNTITGIVVGQVLEGLRKAPVPTPRPYTDEERELAASVAKEVEPIIAHATNQEPWYQSRVTWGALISIASGALALTGASSGLISAEDMALFTEAGLAVGTVLGGGLTLYGRWRAKKPIGW